MIVPNFIMVAAAYASTLYITAPSTVLMQESWNNIYAVDMIDELSYYPSIPQKTIITIKQNKHNFDANLGQIGVENQKWLHPSLSEVFDRCKNLNVVRAALKRCCKHVASQYNAEQAVLGFYGAENFKNIFTNPYVQKNASYVEVKISTLVDEELEEDTWLRTEKVESLPVYLEEDAFAHKDSSAHDAFTVEDSLVERTSE